MTLLSTSMAGETVPEGTLLCCRCSVFDPSAEYIGPISTSFQLQRWAVFLLFMLIKSSSPIGIARMQTYKRPNASPIHLATESAHVLVTLSISTQR